MGRLLLGITLMTVLLSAHAHAELKELGEIPGADGWKLAANPDTEVCMMTAHYTLRNGSTMTLMLMNGNEGWAISIANNKWELPTGAKYRLNFEMSTGKKYYASSEVVNPKILFAGSLKDEVISEISRAVGMKIYTEDMVSIGNPNLKGSSKAISAVGQCTDTLKKANERNPFEKNSPRSQSNPFENNNPPSQSNPFERTS